MKTLIAEQGKVWAYKENGEEIILGSVLYLGKNDNGYRYYEIDDPSNDNSQDIVIENNEQ